MGGCLRGIMKFIGFGVLAIVALAFFGSQFGDPDDATPTPRATTSVRIADEPTPTADDHNAALNPLLTAQASWTPTPAPTTRTVAQSAPTADALLTCASFDSWIWAQAVYDQNRTAYGALDPDLNGIACEHLTVSGFAPVIWTDAVPAGATRATVTGVTDGDTIHVRLDDGTEDTVRLLHIDTPESGGTIGQCGADQATAYLDWILSYADGGTVYLDSDVTERDRYDRRLAYVWFTVAGDPHPYMANDAMILAGWAESETYEPDSKYKEQLDASEQFSIDHVTGVRLLCGTFGQPADTAAPSDEQVKQAYNNQPNQGQLPAYPGLVTVEMPTAAPQAGTTANTGIVPAPAPTDAPPLPTEAPATQCDDSYPDFCIPPYALYGDLDCGDVGGSWFTVYPPDPHGFDRDGDGYGCEAQ